MELGSNPMWPLGCAWACRHDRRQSRYPSQGSVPSQGSLPSQGSQARCMGFCPPPFFPHTPSLVPRAPSPPAPHQSRARSRPMAPQPPRSSGGTSVPHAGYAGAVSDTGMGDGGDGVRAQALAPDDGSRSSLSSARGRGTRPIWLYGMLYSIGAVTSDVRPCLHHRMCVSALS